MVPSFAIVGAGIDPTEALIISQVVLSLVLPIPLIALLLLTRRADIMGPFANGRWTNLAAGAGATLVLGLNILLVLTSIGLILPFGHE